MPSPKGYTVDKRFITEEHFDTIMEACDVATLPDPRIHEGVAPALWWRALLATAWVTRLRIGELLGLRWEDVDLERGTLWSRARNNNKGKRDTRHSMGGAVELLRQLPQTDPRVFPWNHHARTLWAKFAMIQQAGRDRLALLPEGRQPGP